MKQSYENSTQNQDSESEVQFEEESGSLWLLCDCRYLLNTDTPKLKQILPTKQV